MPDQTAPFGDPDGSRADLDSIIHGFITFGGSISWGALATRPDDLRARIIVGRKGSGKTVYLRRLQAYAADQTSVYATPIELQPPDTDLIIRFCQWFPATTLEEKWTALWRCAIYRSLVSRILRDDKLSAYLGPDDYQRLHFPELMREFRTPVSIYSQVREIITGHDTAHQVTKYLQHPYWEDLRYELSRQVRKIPPICFYLDGIDYGFENAPMFWLRSQKGLFHQVMNLLRDPWFGSQIHVFITVRDLVMSSILRSEHATRHLGETYIRVLNWNKTAISYFFSSKISILSDELFSCSLDGGKTIRSWLGPDEIRNTVRKIDEPTEQYLLRHTRLLPRDIVILGNALCSEVLRAKRNPESIVSAQAIRDVVSRVAKQLGHEQLEICGNQVASDTIPDRAALRGYANTYIANREYSRSIGEELQRLIRDVGKDRFGRAELDTLRSRGTEIFGNGVDIPSVLWQNGLLGYSLDGRPDSPCVFFSEEQLDSFVLPPDREGYAFHSILIDTVRIQAVGKMPVLSF